MFTNYYLFARYVHDFSTETIRSRQLFDLLVDSYLTKKVYFANVNQGSESEIKYRINKKMK